MKTIITTTIAIVVLVASLGATLMIGAQSAYAETDYQLGFRIGISDAHKPPDQRVMSDPVNDFEHHSQSFNNGWGDGFCSVMKNNNSEFDCNDDDL
jgi:hypothetical protein